VRARLNQTHAEWGFIVLIAVLCTVLSLLQYRWTGQVSRAEAEHLRVGISEEAQQFCHVFDSVLTENCVALIPDGEGLNNENRETNHVRQFLKWKSGHPRPLFSRVAVAVSMPDGLQLFEQNQTTGKLKPISWPAEWDSLRSFFLHEPGNGPPFEDLNGIVFQFPVFSHPRGNDGPPDDSGGRGDNGPPGDGPPPHGPGHRPENEWVIFEFDTNYLCKTWLPDLTQRFLNPGPQPFNDVEIKTISKPRTLIFSSPATATNNFESPVTVPLNRQGRSAGSHRGPGGDSRWQLEARPHTAAVEAVVNASRRRNLAVALFLNGLIFAAGFALLVHTRRSRQLAQAQLTFAANVSHELRTPLTVIRGAGHNLLRGIAREPAQIEQYSRLIIQHAEQLTHMVEQILELAGVKKGSSAVSREPVAIAEIVREAILATKLDTEAAHCEVHLELSSDLPPVSGDAPALRRVFQNLIINAAKHGGEGGWIGIAAATVEADHRRMIEIKVADRGPGIPNAELSEIFKPFFRGSAAQRNQIRGGGLGLSLVREIVEAHGGTISVESQAGNGAIFIVRLPTLKN
jgi:signal transduction histidine kinase